MKTEPAKRKAEPRDGERQTVVTSSETSGLNKARASWRSEPVSSFVPELASSIASKPRGAGELD